MLPRTSAPAGDPLQRRWRREITAAPLLFTRSELHGSGHLEADILRALPKHGLAERSEVFQPRGQRDEVIAGELAHLACEMHAAIGEQDFSFADAAGIKNDLPGRGVAGMVLVRDAEIEIA